MIFVNNLLCCWGLIDLVLIGDGLAVARHICLDFMLGFHLCRLKNRLLHGLSDRDFVDLSINHFDYFERALYVLEI